VEREYSGARVAERLETHYRQLLAR